MNLFTKALSKIFKSGNQQQLDNIKHLINAVNGLETSISILKADDFKKRTEILRLAIKNGEDPKNILPESFALVREAAKRVLGERHYDVQLAGGIILNQGKIAEMKTGEGKTLVSTLPAYFNSLSGNGVHIVTVNDYLAKRDSEWMGKVFNYLGVSTGCVVSGLEDNERKINYEHDITYGTNNEFGFDYLRDNMKYSISDMVQRGHDYCIVDEVDSILIDESRTPLIISGRLEDKSNYYLLSNEIVMDDFKTDPLQLVLKYKKKFYTKIKELIQNEINTGYYEAFPVNSLQIKNVPTSSIQGLHREYSVSRM